ncbi:TRAP transporter small permease [Anaerostipes hadrus]|uniref:TRAP transporter small permease n=1 Tax=Anaerostipes hadrus TaxID=649756 RepID=A0AAQ3JIZ6_ANAHA|nr:TRAP transporter small permease [Anaerostipes hadrus]WMD16867.1 TRAP transporter small permease [Anaerostipes hadrus]WMD25672.1 TRAP transporter small permease [Anaerostipes hadrus]
MKMIFKFDRLINTILRIIVMIMLSIMSIVVFAQVIFRIVHLSIPWSEELSKYLLIWCTFLGSAMCIRKGSLVGLEFLKNSLPQKQQKLLQTFLNLIVCLLLIFLIVVGFWAVKRVCFQITPVLKQSMGLMYAAIPVGSVFMLINQILTTIYLWKGDENA